LWTAQVAYADHVATVNSSSTLQVTKSDSDQIPITLGIPGDITDTCDGSSPQLLPGETLSSNLESRTDVDVIRVDVTADSTLLRIELDASSEVSAEIRDQNCQNLDNAQGLLALVDTAIDAAPESCDINNSPFIGDRSVVFGVLETPGDRDVFKFQVDHDDAALTLPSAASGTSMTLYDAACAPLAQPIFGKIEQILSQGLYYVEVTSQPSPRVFFYDLRLFLLQSGGRDAFEPDDGDRAPRYPIGMVMKRTFHQPSDSDRVRIYRSCDDFPPPFTTSVTCTSTSDPVACPAVGAQMTITETVSNNSVTGDLCSGAQIILDTAYDEPFEREFVVFSASFPPGTTPVASYSCTFQGFCGGEFGDLNPPGVVTGRVTDLETNTGIPFVNIFTPFNNDVFSDQYGAFSFAGLAGDVTVTFNKTGYAQTFSSVSIVSSLEKTIQVGLPPVLFMDGFE
jgi:hypothetical protein